MNSTELIFEWDRTKAKKNLNKHKVSFEEAKTVFNDSFLITFPDEYHSDTEERWISIGTSMNNKVLTVVHTETMIMDKIITIIISSRKASKLERKIYEE
jgi:uncharacterized DUF497 family protein